MKKVCFAIMALLILSGCATKNLTSNTNTLSGIYEYSWENNPPSIILELREDSTFVYKVLRGKIEGTWEITAEKRIELVGPPITTAELLSAWIIKERNIIIKIKKDGSLIVQDKRLIKKY